MRSARFALLASATSIAASIVLALPASAKADAQTPRVAVLLPFFADALDATDPGLVVASVRRSLRAPLPDSRIDLGNPHAPSFERLAEARPDLVIGDRALHAAIEPELSLGGRAEVVLIDSGSVDATFASLRAVGRLAGVEDAMSARVAGVEGGLADSRVAGDPGVLALFGTPGSFYAVTGRHWLGDLATRIGFRNVASGLADDPRFPGLVVLNDETVAGLQPDLVVLICHGDPEHVRASLEARIRDGGVWAHLGRSATRGVHVLDPALFSSNPGLRLDEAARELARLTDAPDVGSAP